MSDNRPDAKSLFHKQLKTDGSVVDYPPAGKYYTQKELQQAVGECVEAIPLGRDYRMVVNEEGAIHGLPANERATALCGIPIVGAALVCRSTRGGDLR